jgi:O-antigen/teichoic acid export membrane protein
MVPGREHIQSLFEFAKYAWLGNVSNRAYNSVDIAVLGLFVTSELIGIYSVAWSIAMFLSIFGQSLEGTFFPEMSKNAGQSGSGTVRKLTEDALRYSGLVTIPGFVGGLIVGDRLLLIYGSSFQKGTIILVILIGAALLYAYLRQLRNTLNAIDRPDLAFRVNAVFIGVNMILNLVLIWQFSWVGAAVATLVSAGVGLVMAYYHIRSEVRISIPLRSIGRQCIAATVMGSLVFGLRQVIEPYWHSQPNIVFVVFLVSIGAVVYFGVLAAIWPDFRLTVTNNLSIKKFPG